MKRCGWAGNDLSIPYHDAEWGVPVHDDRRLFEFLILEGAQAGLSWNTILKRRDGYRNAFADFDPVAVSQFGQAEIDRLLADPGIIRNRLKVDSAIKNGRAFLEVQAEFGSADAFLWRCVGGQPVTNSWTSLQEVPVRTEASDALSADLKRRGFNFVGTTICYAFMQAVGMVNDHLVDCFRHAQIRKGTPDRGR